MGLQPAARGPARVAPFGIAHADLRASSTTTQLLRQAKEVGADACGTESQTLV